MAFNLTPKRVSVIGCGAAGLAAARELKKEGHEVVVFERGSRLGGMWVYSPEVESDSLGLNPTRKIVHSSVYSSLRTNVPREAMGFRDFPFLPSGGQANRDSRRFPGHEEVLRYLEDYAHEFDLIELVRYETEVTHVGLITDGKWMVKYRKRNDKGSEGSEIEETYDAVVVCTGHFTQPKLSENIPGIEVWPGRQIHSHNYRAPEPYKDQVVVVIGLAVSGIEISAEIARFAKEVHVSTRNNVAGKYGKHSAYDNLWLHPMVERAHEDGRVSFYDGSVVLADAIIHCTGYTYNFPFLDTNGVVNVDDNRVGPLYKHVFPPTLSPGLSFVGIPTFAIHFYVFELQSKWIAGVLSGRISLPSQEKMMEDVQALYSDLEAKGVPKHHTHKIHNFKFLADRLIDPEFEYEDWLAAQSGCPPTEKWRKKMFYTTLLEVPKHTGTYRDELDYDHPLVLQAYQHITHKNSAVNINNNFATSAL